MTAVMNTPPRTATGTLAHHFEDLEQQHEREPGDVDVPGHRGHVLRRPDRRLHRLPVHRPPAFALASRQLNVWHGTINTVVLLTSSLTMALAVHAGERGPQAGPLPAPDDGPGDAFLVVKAIEYYEEYEEHLFPGPFFSTEAPGGPAGLRRLHQADRAVLRLLLLHDRPACPPHGHRPRPAGLMRSWRVAGGSRPEYNTPLELRGSTGTSSTSSGSSSTRCST